MPKRIVDGDAVAGSDKLAELAASGRHDCVSHYEKLLCLALANGSFEYNVADIARRFGKILPWMTAEDWSRILVAYEKVKLLFTWRDAQTGKRWGYWVKIEGRLPSRTDVVRHRYPLGVPVPVAELAEFLGRPVAEVEAELRETAASMAPAEVQARRQARARAGGRARTRDGHAADTCQRGLGVGVGEDKGRIGKAEQRDAPVSATGPSAPASLGSPTARPAEAGAEGAGDFFLKNGTAPSAQPGQAQQEQGTGYKPVLQGSSYRRFQEKWRECCGRVPGDGPAKVARYRRLCADFGEEVVLHTVEQFAGQRGGAKMLRGNRYAEWDFLDGSARAEILGGMAERGKQGAARKADPKCKACGGSGLRIVDGRVQGACGCVRVQGGCGRSTNE